MQNCGSIKSEESPHYLFGKIINEMTHLLVFSLHTFSHRKKYFRRFHLFFVKLFTHTSIIMENLVTIQQMRSPRGSTFSMEFDQSSQQNATTPTRHFKLVFRQQLSQPLCFSTVLERLQSKPDVGSDNTWTFHNFYYSSVKKTWLSKPPPYNLIVISERIQLKVAKTG